ncbi:ATP-binding protein [Litoreibacter roseus]|uniref:Histidine kinase/DNA gyrase B/HSP90-like ATPase n=1 Tax=Litoreibacter roseus TaxID=2601869 RepID=A0A6N6JKZ3_9RHOB|nr:ATP-binding protein [Litoreibacter roseus]GFE66991.1 hypothetical protein KIN_40650 [Litoreibacter roseus]
MTRTIEVVAQKDFWQRLAAGSPLRALSELVSNSFDADASTVRISLSMNQLGLVTKVVVKDDGEGISYSATEHLFSQLGNSWKMSAVRSRSKKRLLQGKNGEGRFRALSLGEIVTWSTVYEEDGRRLQYQISTQEKSIGTFEISDISEAKAKATGTTVTIENIFEKTASYFSKDRQEDLLHSFAPYLNKYRDADLYFDGKRIDVGGLVASAKETKIGPLKLSGGIKISAVLEILEWSSDLGRAFYLCDETGFTISERPPEIRAPGFSFSAYVKSSHISQLQASSLADIDMEEGLIRLVKEAREILSRHFRDREKQKAESLIQKWRDERVYPFADAEDTPVIRQTKKIFNMCAVTINKHAKDFDAQGKVSKALSFRLLREVIEDRPADLTRILSDVLNLSKDKRKQFASLLNKTALTDIIDTVAFVDHRLNAARGLRSLVCYTSTRKTVKERQHIHQIVERNPWLFGEEFALGQSESSLTNSLKEHLRRLKRPVEVLHPVLLPGGKNARIDIMLCQTNKISGRTDDHHLIIELKRAKKKLDLGDFSQLMKYADAIMKDVRYEKTGVKWSFWLVGVSLAPELESLAEASDRPRGCAHVFKEGEGSIWVKTWGQVLHDCISRHEFVREKLDIAISDEEAVAYLNEIYPEFVPQAG